MPTYEYECEACGHGFERFQKMSDDPVEECPECEEPEVRRIISPGGGLVFKGPGFYATDYRDEGRSGREKEESGDREAGETSGTEGGGPGTDGD